MSTANGHKVHFIEQGSGLPVVLVHGIAASLHNWAYLMPELATSHYHPLALDLLGHGDSAKPEAAHVYHIDSLYDHFRGWLGTLDLGQPVVLVGHSLGSYLSLLHAWQFPEAVQALVLIDPFYSQDQLTLPLKVTLRRPDFSSRMLQLAPLWLVEMILGWAYTTARLLPPAMRHQVAKDYKRANPNILHIAPSARDLTPELARIQTETLVIWGTRDHTLNPESFPELVRRLPNASGHPLEGAGHTPHLTRPERVNHLVLGFLNGRR